MNNVCADSGFLIALYDSSDSYNATARRLFQENLDRPPFNRFALPWPIMYETLSTRLARDRRTVEMIERDLKRMEMRRQLEYWDDKPFRDQAFENFVREIDKPRLHYRALSLVDRVVRLMLADVNLKMDLFITFNGGDFHDVCRESRIVMIP
ncbi:MAG: hypothetical protein ACLQVG_09550 [Terriglobia bacterium]